MGDKSNLLHESSPEARNGFQLLRALTGMDDNEAKIAIAQYCNVPPIDTPKKKLSYAEAKKEALSNVPQNALIAFADSLEVRHETLQQSVSQEHLGWRYGKPLWIWPGTFQIDNSQDAEATKKYGKRPFEKGKKVTGFWRHNLITKDIETLIVAEGCKDGITCLDAELEKETTLVVAAYSEKVFASNYTKKNLSAFVGKVIILALDKDAVEKRFCDKKAAAKFYELGAKEVWFFSWENLDSY